MGIWGIYASAMAENFVHKSCHPTEINSGVKHSQLKKSPDHNLGTDG